PGAEGNDRDVRLQDCRRLPDVLRVAARFLEPHLFSDGHFEGAGSPAKHGDRWAGVVVWEEGRRVVAGQEVHGLEPTSMRRFVMRSKPRIWVHSETILPTTCPHFPLGSIARKATIQPIPVISRTRVS